MRQIETKGMMEQFQAHLNNTNNQRIIFSGCFGSCLLYTSDAADE